MSTIPIYFFSPHNNYVINGNFDFWQRGTSLTSGTGARYLADRFINVSSGSTYSVSRQNFTTGQTEVPNNPSFFHRTVVSSVAGSSNYALVSHRLEGVRPLSNKQITLSFWAKADSSKPISLEFTQFFGSGGSPSTQVVQISVKKVILSTSWQKITQTFLMPSIEGKTIGTSGTDTTELRIWFDAGSDSNSSTDSLGQQSGTFDIAQVQIEEGSVAREFVLAGGNLEGELAACQRYYELSTQGAIGGLSPGYVSRDPSDIPNGANAGNINQLFRVLKRATPNITIYGVDGIGTSPNTIQQNGTSRSVSVDGATSSGFRRLINTSGVTWLAGTDIAFNWVADAEL
jgi:hypothetical protein